MKAQKLRDLIHNIESALATSPHQILKTSSSGAAAGIVPRDLECVTCDEFKRHNYSLKQELCKMQEKEERMWEAESELIAVRELYELKCQEVELLKRELTDKVEVAQKLRQKSEIFCSRNIRMLEKALAEIEDAPAITPLY